MHEKIWDLTPDGGGPPVQVVVGNPNEAIAAHPERYTRKAPDGTVQAAIADADAEKGAARAAIEQKKREKLAAIAKQQSEKMAAIDKEQAEAKTAALTKQREDAAKTAKESGDVPSRDGEKAAIEAEAHAAAELAQQEADQELAALDAAPSRPLVVKIRASKAKAKRPKAKQPKRRAAKSRAGKGARK